ncbi:hypothetical protein JTB14_002688 [Gonioctena quinquepunctata]|nr:hypothetical protein JTB14_002688 [Gonioctena quinquepunctata]
MILLQESMWWTVLFTLLLPLPLQALLDCSKIEYDKCIRIADPLVKEARLIFPDNLNDIDQVCSTWNELVDCLKIYIDGCFTDQQRRQFNKAVESPIESVHEMCMQPSYQKDYLQYAPCIKNTIIQRIHCGLQYNLLVEQVDQGEIISKSTLCCSHDRFKQCVQRETRRLCDKGDPDGPASRFAVQIINKALQFLQDQCLNYIPNSGDCSIYPTDPYSDRFDPHIISTSSSEIHPWRTIQELLPKIEPSSKTVPTTPSISTWGSPSSPTSGSMSPGEFPTQMLGSRTRPASYGRSNSWSEGIANQNSAGNTVQMYPEVSSMRSTKSDWTTTSSTNPSVTETSRNTARVYSSPPWNPRETSSESWYPAAGNQLNNEVDEPNQLGLTKYKNSAGVFRSLSALPFFLLTHLIGIF